MPVMTKTGKKLLQSVCAHWESALEKEELIQLTAIGTLLFCPKVGLAGNLLRVCVCVSRAADLQTRLLECYRTAPQPNFKKNPRRRPRVLEGALLRNVQRTKAGGIASGRLSLA